MSACLWLEIYWVSHFLAVWTSTSGQPAPSGQPPRHSNGAVTKPSSPGYLTSCSFPHALIQAPFPQMDLLRPHGRLLASRTQVRNMMPTEAGTFAQGPSPATSLFYLAGIPRAEGKGTCPGPFFWQLSPSYSSPTPCTLKPGHAPVTWRHPR